MTLSSLGWDDFFSASFAAHTTAGFTPARVACEHKHAYDLYSASGELTATCTGKLLHETPTQAALPAVGDWVAIRIRPGETRADIHAVLPRRTRFSRRAAGHRPYEQIVAANVDIVFLVTALDANYNLRRIERFLAAAWESGAQPVVLLNKSDLHPAAHELTAEVAAAARPAAVLTVSALTGAGLDALSAYAQPGRTLAFLGSSGVGKSTLINALLGDDRLATTANRAADNRGRHTTTRRELLVAPSGALVMDTPGMRELQFHEDRAEVDETFGDVVEFATRCRFSNCRHGTEPGCAIQAAMASGALAQERWASYLKLSREQAFAAQKIDAAAARKTKSAWKKINADITARSTWQQKKDRE